MLTKRMSERIDQIIASERLRLGRFISKEGFIHAALLLVITNEDLRKQAFELNDYFGNLGREQIERLEELM